MIWKKKILFYVRTEVKGAWLEDLGSFDSIFYWDLQNKDLNLKDKYFRHTE